MTRNAEGEGADYRLQFAITITVSSFRVSDVTNGQMVKLQIEQIQFNWDRTNFSEIRDQGGIGIIGIIGIIGSELLRELLRKFEIRLKDRLHDEENRAWQRRESNPGCPVETLL